MMRSLATIVTGIGVLGGATSVSATVLFTSDGEHSYGVVSGTPVGSLSTTEFNSSPASWELGFDVSANAYQSTGFNMLDGRPTIADWSTNGTLELWYMTDQDRQLNLGGIDFYDSGMADFVNVIDGVILDLVGDGQWHKASIDYSVSAELATTTLAPTGAPTYRLRLQNWGGPLTPVYLDDIALVPEPASLALLSLGGLALVARRRGR